MKKNFLLFLGLFLFASCKDEEPAVIGPTIDSAAIFRKTLNSPEQCQSCHPKHYDEWQISMHAYSFKDPVFFTLNKIGQERSNGNLGDFCVRCHAPFAQLLGEAPIGTSTAHMSKISHAGISCESCHKMISSKIVVGQSPRHYRTDSTLSGPIQNPQPNGFHGSHYDPKFEESTICASCHDVVNQRGITVEKTFSEWTTSEYPSTNITCQTCHMKYDSVPAAVGGPKRKVHNHVMEGVDIALSDFPGRDEMIQRVRYLLEFSARMEVYAPAQIKKDSALPLQVKITNHITGHDIPSGTIFERQMWLEVIATDSETGKILFESGTLDENSDLRDSHSDLVKNGSVPEDKNLVLFNGTPYRNGQPIPFFWEADYVLKRTIPSGQHRYGVYTIKNISSSKNIDLSVRLRFRSFPPYLLRMLGHADLVDKLVIFDMEKETKKISVVD